jgi:hypothetical protein
MWLHADEVASSCLKNRAICFDAECSDFQYFWHIERSAVAGASLLRADPGCDQADDD